MLNKIVSFNKEARIVTPDDLMTVSAFAQKHGCSVQYLYKLRNRGKLKMFPRGYLKVSEREALKAMER